MKPRQTTGQTQTPDTFTALIRQHARVLARNVSFGSGVNGDTSQNIDGVWYSGTTPMYANVPFTFSHNLGRVPIGFLVTRMNKAGSIWDGGTPWTATDMTLESNVINATFSIFIF